MQIIHFVSREQIELLKKIFARPTQTIFTWPCASNEAIVEAITWEVPRWIGTMEQYLNNDTC